MNKITACAALVLATGSLSAQEPCFDGSGGPHGDFDWVVRDGEIFIFDTLSTPIVGGPNGVPTAVQVCVGGIVDLRNLVIEEGGEIRVQGPNPMRILATGDVIIRGDFDVSGFNARDVVTLNTGNQPEIGGAGVGGGGRGGLGNPVLTNSSPRGGRGNGPFGEIGTGGEGGESGYAPSNLGVDARRPGGGGGGRFARDQLGGSGPGLTATAGTNGHPLSTGAESGTHPARGGAAGVGPFVDPKPGNDFFGVRPVATQHGQLQGLVRGELPSLWAGYGGGGGGNALPSSTFPTPNWTPSSDEKAGAGGGGGGALHVQALGRIVFGAHGQILSTGGRGGTGENTNFLDHIGGTGGAGSGGHVVLESASEVDFTDGGANTGPPVRDWLSTLGQPIKTGLLTYVNVCCRSYSNGGASGPGVVQIHVPNPVAPPGTNPATTDILVPAPVASARYPLDAVASPGAVALFLTCDPILRPGHSWFGLGGRGALPSFLRSPSAGEELGVPAPREKESGLAFDPSALEIPLRF